MAMTRQDALRLWEALEEARVFQNPSEIWGVLDGLGIKPDEDEERTFAQFAKCWFEARPLEYMGDWLVGEYISPSIWKAAHPSAPRRVVCGVCWKFVSPPYVRCGGCGKEFDENSLIIEEDVVLHSI